MNYVESLNILGLDVKEIPVVKGEGEPATTSGAVGLLYMDTDSGALYKCVAEDGGAYTWELVSGSDYALTDADKTDIANLVLTMLPTAEEGGF